MLILLRLILLQVAWYLIIKFGEDQISVLYPVIAMLLVSIDSAYSKPALTWKNRIIFILFLFTCGLLIDSLLMGLNLIHFRNWNNIHSPFYMWAIWIIFFPYYSIAFEKFHNKIFISAICGFIFAPISYYSGSKIGSLEIQNLQNLVLVGLMWAIFFPTSIQLYFRLKSRSRSSHPHGK